MPLQLYERQKILDACFAVFVRQGYTKASTAMLAEAAGISKALIFHHFKSKKMLYISVLEQCFEKMALEIPNESPTEYSNFFEAKEKVGLTIIDYFRKNPDMNKFMFEANFSTPDDLKMEINKFKAYIKEKYGAMNATKDKQMKQLFNEIPLKDGVDSKEAYELIHIVSEYFRMKLAAELTEVKKLNDDVYWKDFVKKKNAFFDMVRYGIEKNK
ncbi:MAG: TetR/AcrR family transcriptional regulator [Planctomycetes bacterium]|nr:TetR/AcrR family transcriptional regulator [Planctomycetota bacterium]